MSLVAHQPTLIINQQLLPCTSWFKGTSLAEIAMPIWVVTP